MRRIRAPRYSGERRNSVRFPVYLVATVEGQRASVPDLSVSGAPRSVAGGRSPRYRFATLRAGPGRVVTLYPSVRRRLGERDGIAALGLEFQTAQRRALGPIAPWLLTADDRVVAPSMLREGLNARRRRESR